MTLRLATRASPLALEQTKRVVAQLARKGTVDVEVVVVDSEGDRRREVPISKLGTWGAFTNEIEEAVRDRRADVAVHSAKDLPAVLPRPDLVLAAVPERADPRDVLIGSSLEMLAPGALVRTGSPRRRAQLAHLRPDLCFGELRGNITTRLERRPVGGAVLVALAALQRLGIDPLQTDPPTSEVLPLSVMLPQVGQGTLALRCRAEDEGTLQQLAPIDDPVAHRALVAERAFLATLGGGCRAPVGAYATASEASALVEMRAMIATLDGHVVLRRQLSGTEPEELGRTLAAQLLEGDGGNALLSGLR